ncbi:MAG: hypothetical protein WDN06_02550 [Asticcacaulis sp.]
MAANLVKDWQAAYYRDSGREKPASGSGSGGWQHHHADLSDAGPAPPCRC